MQPLPARLDDADDLDRALTALAARDPLIRRLRAATGTPALRRRAAGFEGLSRIIVGQQVSTASAEAIWGRLRAAVDPFEPERLAGAGEGGLRAAGLSRPKIRALAAAAAAVSGGRLDLDGLAALDADSAHARLCAVTGIGPWTADVYLMFCLGHADAWPAGDVALQHAVGAALGLDGRPDARAMTRIGERWRPWRSAAAHLFWAHYASLRGRAGVAA